MQGINNLQAQYEQQFGPGDYKPNIPMAYWNFRLDDRASGSSAP